MRLEDGSKSVLLTLLSCKGRIFEKTVACTDAYAVGAFSVLAWDYVICVRHIGLVACQYLSVDDLVAWFRRHDMEPDAIAKGISHH